MRTEVPLEATPPFLKGARGIKKAIMVQDFSLGPSILQSPDLPPNWEAAFSTD